VITGIISDVARGTTHDGPGLRTTVFFKGCALHCPWCHNPESMRPMPEMMFHEEQCIGCGDCVAACSAGAVTLSDGKAARSRCDACGACAAVCPAAAVRVVGRRLDVEGLVALVRRDRAYHDASGGGVTLSGGEPLLQAEFVVALLDRLRRERFHTAIQTSGHFAWERFAPALDALDLLFFDLKIADPAAHRRVLGVDNAVILENLGRLLTSRPDRTVVRIPLIPTYTATEENLRALARVLAPWRPRQVVLLPWHPFGLAKSRALGRHANPALPHEQLAANEVRRCKALLDRAGLPVR
jgi:pyruvate formate lyase activating enzyme